MLLMSSTDAALAIGARCGSGPAGEDTVLREILRYITPAIESMLEVQTLSSGSYTDYFKCSRTEQKLHGLALANGFVKNGTTLITDPNGNILVEGADYRVGLLTGQIDPLSTWVFGTYTVEYNSGFSLVYPATAVTDAEIPYLVASGVPDWIKGIIIDVVVEWWRTKTAALKLPENVNVEDLLRPLRNDISRRLGGFYFRPRYNIIFPEPK